MKLNFNKFLSDLKEFPAIKAKKNTEPILKELEIKGFKSPHVILFKGEDCASVEFDTKSDYELVFHADSITEKFIEVNPYMAGYSLVMVNVNDIYATAGTPLAMVLILAYEDNQKKIGDELIRGIIDGSKKFRVPIVGGHTHPNDTRNIASAGITGRVKREHRISSSGARTGDIVLTAIDTKGKVGQRYTFGWDCTSMKTSEEVLRHRQAICEIGKAGFATACKDISNAGLIGTLGMLFEASKVGAVIDLKQVEESKPEPVPLSHWVRIFISTGFILTIKPQHISVAIELLESHDLTTAVIGEIDDTKKFKITYDSKTAVFFDFNKESILG
ncbi:MAG: AIR synthase related protein [Candidatus Sifarchaeia archaeon]